ncbi:response regulator transcription factor [Dactylosporangium fulvum]|uniref:Response regulator transcription factor n=1 Tax=Dactylosporangium fulvum TaxID=53359 RepID=A0ABY5VSE6_9ACTN|nr:response regulator transcription factor [Dactylosporangium fulvum]UWP79741.1 response regulator transcription factor [Dactylosporangium fulvum]
MRIVIAEDAALLRDGLRRLLTDSGHDVVAAVDTADALLDAVAAHHPDLAVVDIRMPPTFTDEGLRAAVAVRASRPGTGILLLSQYVVERYTADLLADAGGGIGYLLKDRVADIGDFLDAVGRVGAGGTVLDPEVVRQLLGRSRRADRLAGLTGRERDVLAGMAEGRSNESIAGVLHLSESSVEKYVASIFTKLELTTDRDTNRRVLAVVTYLRS